MPKRVEFYVQAFVHRDGRFEAADRLPAESADEAIELSASLVPESAGAAAVMIVIGDDGRLRAATYLAQHGEVPEGYGPGLLAD